MNCLMFSDVLYIDASCHGCEKFEKFYLNSFQNVKQVFVYGPMCFPLKKISMFIHCTINENH